MKLHVRIEKEANHTRFGNSNSATPPLPSQDSSILPYYPSNSRGGHINTSNSRNTTGKMECKLYTLGLIPIHRPHPQF